MKILYEPYLKEIAKKLRHNSTLSEILLWNELKNKKMFGYDFHRQKPILNYIVDFYSHDLKLVIEVDGQSHDYEDQNKSDIERQKLIEELGLNFLRFSDRMIKREMMQVKWIIESYIIQYKENPQ